MGSNPPESIETAEAATGVDLTWPKDYPEERELA